ncbi:MAG: phosphonate C-P lyase system protein PhnG [Gammaproteobacteria bacterium]|nr:phosphonate C-P lyase system protein PhnG [Gammaproteobacteria bacterium]
MRSRFQSSEALKEARLHWLSVCVRTPKDNLCQFLNGLERPAIRILKAPEVGLVMTQGRTHGTGAPFLLGEASMTRCVVSDTDDQGLFGYGQILGRDKELARAIAELDLLAQDMELGPQIDVWIAAWHDELQSMEHAESERVQATRVDFLTLVRGED